MNLNNCLENYILKLSEWYELTEETELDIDNNYPIGSLGQWFISLGVPRNQLNTLFDPDNDYAGYIIGAAEKKKPFYEKDRILRRKPTESFRLFYYDKTRGIEDSIATTSIPLRWANGLFGASLRPYSSFEDFCLRTKTSDFNLLSLYDPANNNNINASDLPFNLIKNKAEVVLICPTCLKNNHVTRLSLCKATPLQLEGAAKDGRLKHFCLCKRHKKFANAAKAHDSLMEESLYDFFVNRDHNDNNIVLLEWDEKLNKKIKIFANSDISATPKDIAHSSGTKVYWKCLANPAHPSYPASPYARTMHYNKRDGWRIPISCPDCLIVASRQEATILCLAQDYFGEQNVERTDHTLKDKGITEIDVHILNCPFEENGKKYTSVGIEYNGEYWHRIKEDRSKADNDKLDACEAEHIKLITITGLSTNTTYKDDGQHHYEYYIGNTSDFAKILDKVFTAITKSPKTIDLEDQAFTDKVNALTKRLVKEKSLGGKAPVIALDWDYTRNKQIPLDISPWEPMNKAFFKCHICGTLTDKIQVRNRAGYGDVNRCIYKLRGKGTKQHHYHMFWYEPDGIIKTAKGQMTYDEYLLNKQAEYFALEPELQHDPKVKAKYKEAFNKRIKRCLENLLKKHPFIEDTEPYK